MYLRKGGGVNLEAKKEKKDANVSRVREYRVHFYLYLHFAIFFGP